MSQLFPGRRAFSVPVGLLVSLAVASQALAASWSAPIALTTSGGAYFSSGLVGLGTNRLIAVYTDGAGVTVRRSTDSGLTWNSPQVLTSNGREGAISGRGTLVDVIWANSRIRYARSADSGATFAAPVALSPIGVSIESPSIARGPNGLVVATWLQAATTPCCDGPWNIRARVSTDGGRTFGTAKTLGTGWEPAVAAGDGVVYAAWNGLDYERGQPYVRRSRDGGATWSPAASLPRVSAGLAQVHPSITAAGSVAYVAYNVWQEPADPNAIGDTWIRYVRTGDRGGTWSAGRNLTSSTSATADPVLSLKAGTLRAIFGKSDGVSYKQSSDGTNWSSRVTVATFGQPHGVAFAGRIGVLYTSGELFTDVWVRTGGP